MGISVMLGFATGDKSGDPNVVSFAGTDMLKSSLTQYSHGHRWLRLIGIIGKKPNTHEIVDERNHRPTKRVPIVAETNVQGAIPFLVGLLETPNGRRFCEGTLISLMHVLTAAHCVRGGNAKWVAVHSSTGNSPEVIRVADTKTSIHPSFGKPYKTSFDVAILELEYSSAAGRPIVLDNSPDFGDETLGTAYAYDVIARAETTQSNVVLEIDLPMWSRAKCASTMPNIDRSMICAGGKKGEDTCQGDSGGPLVVFDENNQKYLAGMVSGGYMCGVEGIPGIYARVGEVACGCGSSMVVSTKEVGRW